MSAPSPDSWSVAVNKENVADIPRTYGFPDMLGRLWRPYGVSVPSSSAGYCGALLLAIDAEGYHDALPFKWVPHMAPFAHSSATEGERFVSLRHRKGRKSAEDPFPEREGSLRVLSIAGTDSDAGLPTTIRFGEHSDHTGETGFYLGAQHVGYLTVKGAENDEKLVYGPVWPTHVSYKYFPIPADPPTETHLKEVV